MSDSTSFRLTGSPAHSASLDTGMRRMAAIIVLLHVALSLFLGATLSIDVDEACTQVTTSRGPSYAFRRALSFELQPPLYFTALAVWREVSDSLLAARMFSTLCTTGALIVLWMASRRYLPSVNPCVTLSLAAWNPFVVYAATEARCYALVLLISSGLLVLWHDGFLAEQPRRTSQFGYFVLSCVALFTFYPLGLLLAAGGLALTLLRKWRAVRDYSLVMAGVMICFLPLAWLVPSQVATHTESNTAPPTVLAAARLVFWHIRNVVLPVNWSVADLVAPVAWCAAGMLILWSLRTKWAKWRKSPQFGLFMVTGLLLILFTPFVMLTGTRVFADRHLAPAVLPLLLCVVGAAQLAIGRRGLAVSALIMLTFTTTSLVARYHDLAKPGDWANAARFVMTHEESRQPIVVFRPSAALGFEHHYHGTNIVVPLPIAATGDHYDVSKYVLTDEAVIETKLGETGIACDHLWVVTEVNLENRSENDFGYFRLTDYLTARYTVELDQTLFGSHVRLLRRHPRGLPISHTATTRSSP